MSDGDRGEYIWDGTRLVPSQPKVHPAKSSPWPVWLTRERFFAVGVPLLFLLVGLGVYGAWLDTPERVVFDETHYLKASRAFAAGEWMNPDWSDSRPHNWEHPPLPKLAMALMIWLFGDTPAAYRVPSLLFGAAGLAGMSVLGRRLFQSDAAAVVAPLLLLAEPMWYTHSRLAILEIFVAAPLIWAFAFAMGRSRWAPYATGGAFALAFVAKYSALFLLPALLVILVWRGLDRDRLGIVVVRALLLTLALPLLLLFVFTAPFLWVWVQTDGVVFAVQHWWFILMESFSWGADGPKDHPEQLAPLYWLTMRRPTWYYVWWGPGTGAERSFAAIYAIGNPVIWWGGLLLAVALLLPVVLRVVRAMHGAERVAGALTLRLPTGDRLLLTQLGGALLIFATGYLPFFLLSRATYLYYMVLLLPYLSLVATGAVVWLWRLRGTDGAVDGPAKAAAAGGGFVPLSTFDVAPGAAPTPPVEPKWRVHLAAWRERFAELWWGPWPARVVAVAFVLGAYVLALYWIPLFTGFSTTKGVVDEAWQLVPWMERIVKPG